MSLDTADQHGRYPVHVAMANGCTPEVIRFLVETKPLLVGTQDVFGRTPMHYAGEYSKNFIDDYFEFPDFNEVQRNKLEVAVVLIAAAPQSVNIEDKDEMNPIEHALLNGSSIKVIKAMQRASRTDWRAKRKIELGHVQGSSPLKAEDFPFQDKPVQRAQTRASRCA